MQFVLPKYTFRNMKIFLAAYVVRVACILIKRKSKKSDSRMTKSPTLTETRKSKTPKNVRL